MEKTELLRKTHESLKELCLLSPDLLYQAGLLQTLKHVQNYFREDLDYPPHSARAVDKLLGGLIFYVSQNPASLQIYERLIQLQDLWSTQLKG